MKPLVTTAAILLAICFAGATALVANSDVRPPLIQKSGDNRIVFVTKTGSKYHLADCGSLSKSRIPLRLGDARRDYRPCSVCNPPK